MRIRRISNLNLALLARGLTGCIPGIMVTGGDDGVVSVWRKYASGEQSHLPHAFHSDSSDGEYELVRGLHGHRLPVTCLAVSKAFNFIASGSQVLSALRTLGDAKLTDRITRSSFGICTG